MGQGLVQMGVVWGFPGRGAGCAGALRVCFVVLGVHSLPVYVQGCADFFAVGKEGWELNGNRNSEVLLPGSVLAKYTNQLA